MLSDETSDAVPSPEPYEPRRNKRAKLSSLKESLDHARPGAVQLTPILKLPIELLTVIPSWYPEIPAFPTLGRYGTHYPEEYCFRPDTLRALSQTCKALRLVFLPLLWEKLEACTARFGGAAYRQVAETLEVRCELLKTRPDLGALVRVANVSLTRYHQGTVLPALASCLAILPNIHTLQIVYAHKDMTTALKKSFELHSFPQIRKVVLPSHAHNILRSCPEVREVTCTHDDGSKLVTAIKMNCPRVEVMDGFHPTNAMMKRIIKAAPGLRHITLPISAISRRPLYSRWICFTLQDSTIHLLTSLKDLNSIDFLFTCADEMTITKSTYTAAMWNQSEELTVMEGCSQIKFCDSLIFKAARAVLKKSGAAAEGNGKQKDGGSRKRIQRPKAGVGDKKEVTGDKRQIKRIRVRHRKITTLHNWSMLCEEWFEALEV